MGTPARFWGGGFYFIQGFLTAVLQNYARKHVVAIDKLDFDFQMCEKDMLVAEPPEDGCYVHGFFLEGCKFDFDKMALAESDSRVLFVKAPMIYFMPKLIDDIDYEAHCYRCPCYRTS